MTKSSAGVLARAEIIPLEPDAGSAAEGKVLQEHTILPHWFLITI